jgi:hypothetical protein
VMALTKRRRAEIAPFRHDPVLAKIRSLSMLSCALGA